MVTNCINGGEGINIMVLNSLGGPSEVAGIGEGEAKKDARVWTNLKD